MFTKLSKQLSECYVSASVATLAAASLAQANSSFDYFGEEIDYWGKTQASPKVTNRTKRADTTPTPPRFNWDRFTNPANKEFFSEGDYTPPEPFLEIVRNPTDENLKRWFEYIGKKNELSSRLQTRMREYLSKSSAQLTPSVRTEIEAKAARLPSATDPDHRRYRFRMYFDSKCPHCKRMFETLADLQDRGFYVEALQIDRDPKGLQGMPVPVRFATPEELTERKVESVPFLLVGDLQRKAVYPIRGYQSTSAIFAALAQNSAETH